MQIECQKYWRNKFLNRWQKPFQIECRERCQIQSKDNIAIPFHIFQKPIHNIYIYIIYIYICLYVYIYINTYAVNNIRLWIYILFMMPEILTKWYVKAGIAWSKFMSNFSTYHWTCAVVPLMLYMRNFIAPLRKKFLSYCMSYGLILCMGFCHCYQPEQSSKGFLKRRRR